MLFSIYIKCTRVCFYMCLFMWIMYDGSVAFIYKRLLNLNQRKRCWRTLHSFVLWWIRFTFTLGPNNTKLGNLIQGNLKQSYELTDKRNDMSTCYNNRITYTSEATVVILFPVNVYDITCGKYVSWSSVMSFSCSFNYTEPKWNKIQFYNTNI